MNGFEIRGQRVRSRYFLAPINTGLARERHPSPALLRFHSLRAGPDIGVAYVGNVAIERDVVTNPRTLVSSRHPSWQQLSAVIRVRGSRAGIQLACKAPGPPLQRSWITDNVPLYVERSADALSRIGGAELRRLERLFARAILVAEAQGFEVFQVHAAHGYLLSHLLSRSVNRRTDRYAWPGLAMIEGIVSRVRRKRPNLVLDIRVSLLEGIQDRAAELADRIPLLTRIADCGFDLVSVSGGHYGVDKTLIYPRLEDGHGVYVPYVEALARQRPDVIWSVSGNVFNLQELSRNCPTNICFGIARALIADPLFVRKSLLGISPVPCDRNGACHYYSRGADYIRCPQSPDLRD